MFAQKEANNSPTKGPVILPASKIPGSKQKIGSYTNTQRICLHNNGSLENELFLT